MVPAAAFVGRKILRSGKVCFKTRPAAHARSASGGPQEIVLVQSNAAFEWYIGGVREKLSCSRFQHRQTREPRPEQRFQRVRAPNSNMAGRVGFTFWLRSLAGRKSTLLS